MPKAKTTKTPKKTKPVEPAEDLGAETPVEPTEPETTPEESAEESAEDTSADESEEAPEESTGKKSDTLDNSYPIKTETAPGGKVTKVQYVNTTKKGSFVVSQSGARISHVATGAEEIKKLNRIASNNNRIIRSQRLPQQR